MKPEITAITAILLVGSITSFATAEGVPAWVKNNAGWWADGTISESEFIQGIQFLIKDGIIVVPMTSVSAEKSEGVPAWVKNNAGWWADGTISDGEFVNGIQHLIKTGIISVPVSQQMSETPMKTTDDSKLAVLEAELERCAEIVKAYPRLNCEKAAKHQIEAYSIKKNGQSFQAGPVTYYWPGLGTEGNSFEITESGQAILSVRILAENNGSSDNVSMMCTGPAVCNYDVWNGEKAFKYSGMDFTNGQIVLQSGESAIFNMLFGPNIGYGGTQFIYDPSKDYVFRISEPYGSVNIPLNIQ
ncbi:peptidase [Nitrosopumilus sp. K4]|uniref:peptidase n=1 Tax=Nitrosopumilus sp. K4 TaxID=2795383 RepID=UPI001BA63709|nr:peptidase [Nitrosopumilus sp. K4]QUC63983.1 peptidase [Nitrosopumilus sp. K4]